MQVSAKDLIALRTVDRRQAFETDQLPSSLSAAYRLAAEAVGLAGRPVAAWKLGGATASTRQTFGTRDVYFGPLTDDEIWSAESGDALPVLPIFQAEAEIALRLGRDLSLKDGHDRLSEDVFDAWAPALECPYSCVENLPQAGLAALVMDRCAAGALIVGEPGRDLASPRMQEALTIEVEGRTVAEGDLSTLLMSPFDAALRFATVALKQGFTLAAGQWISTGGLSPCVRLPHDRIVQLKLGGASVLRVRASRS
jgi:2-keto-4-pentenoate hydratase